MYTKLTSPPYSVPSPVTYSDSHFKEQREKVTGLMANYVTLPLAQHLVSVECAMYELASHFGDGAQAERWALAGLLHDIDWDACQKSADLHCQSGSREWLTNEGIDSQLVKDAFSHYGMVEGIGTEGSGLPVDSLLRKALFSVDELCGFIVACSLVRPSKSIMDMEPSSVTKKLKDKHFAAQVDRALIRSCEVTLKTEWPALVALTLAAMKKYGAVIESMR